MDDPFCRFLFSNTKFLNHRSEPNKTFAKETSEVNDESINGLKSPAYDGKYLHKLARNILGEKRLGDTLTNVVIPAYDIKKLSPVVFSSYQVIVC